MRKIKAILITGLAEYMFLMGYKKKNEGIGFL